MKLLRVIIVMLVVLAISITSFAQTRSDKLKPAWMKGIPQHNNPTYQLSSVVSSGHNLTEIRTKSLSDLASDLGLEKGVTAITDYQSSEIEQSTSVNGKTSSFEASNFELHSTINGKPVSFKARVVDEYWEKTLSGDIIMTRLYAHSTTEGKAFFDDFVLTEKYANDPVTWVLSLVPGAAQMHKGSYIKGGIILGGSAALAGGVFAFEQLRSSYQGKINQTHSADAKKEYYNRAGNSAKFRNICLGGLGAIYVYNIIDAYVAPGARRLIIKPSSTGKGQYGMAVSYNF